MLRDDSFLALRPEWLLRNDNGQKVILYQMSTDSIHYQILDPQAAVVTSFLNGQRTVSELVDAIRYVGDLPSEHQARLLLNSVVDALNVEEEKITVLDKPADWKIDYNPLDFIVSPDDFSLHRRLTMPISLLLYFSGRCQTSCVYCYADLDNMRRLRHLSLQEWFSILNEARAQGIRILQLTGGDVLCRSDAINFINYLIEQGFLFMLSTKCHVSLSDVRKLVDAGFSEPVHGIVREFQVSIDSPNSLVADSLAGRKGYLGRAIDTVRNLIKGGIPPRVKAVLTPLNYRQALNHVETFSALGVRQFMFSLYARSYYRHDDSLFMSDEMKLETASVLQGLAERRPELNIQGDGMEFIPTSRDDQQEKEKTWQERAACSAGRTTLGIAPDGRAALCEQMPLSEPFFLGDLTRQSISEVWNSPEMLYFVYPPRDRFAGTSCYDCADFDDCVYTRGYCFRDAYFHYGRLCHPPPTCPKAPISHYRLK